MSRSTFVFFFSFVLSRFIRAVNWCVVKTLRMSGVKIEVACISNCRDEVDVFKFGFRNIRSFPIFMPWILFQWNQVWGQLYMIGSLTEEIAGDLATEESIYWARQQFIAAVTHAANNGATTVLYAAATKRLFKKGELESMFPRMVFTLGDNFTGLLLGEQILDAFVRTGLEPTKATVLLIAPYGLLGGVALQYLLRSGCRLIVMGSRKRQDLLEGIASKYTIESAYTFEEVYRKVGEVDMVVACNSAPGFRLNNEEVTTICRHNHKLIVIDPNEPQNMTPSAYEGCGDKVIRIDAGNGMSKDLRYVLGGLAAGVLRLRNYVTWGCFCESLIIAANFRKLAAIDWYEISGKNIEIISKYYGHNPGQIGLPPPLNFNVPIKNFDRRS